MAFLNLLFSLSKISSRVFATMLNSFPTLILAGGYKKIRAGFPMNPARLLINQALLAFSILNHSIVYAESCICQGVKCR
jgi:hypothetical protein